MSIELGTLYPPAWRGQPAHMSSLDTPLWSRFQAKHGSEFTGFYFDAALGTPSTTPPDTPDNLQKMWTRLTSKRMDAVGVKPDEWWILEMRPNASMGALGTIITYTNLWRLEPLDHNPIISVIVTDFPDPDLVKLAPLYGVEIITV